MLQIVFMFFMITFLEIRRDLLFVITSNDFCFWWTRFLIFSYYLKKKRRNYLNRFFYFFSNRQIEVKNRNAKQALTKILSLKEYNLMVENPSFSKDLLVHRMFSNFARIRVVPIIGLKMQSIIFIYQLRFFFFQ